MRRMDEEWALACHVFGSTCQNSRVQFELVLLFLMCVGQVCGIHEVMRASMEYRPVIDFFAYSLIYSAFDLSRNCRWGFAIVVVSVAHSSSVAPFPISPSLFRPPYCFLLCSYVLRPTILALLLSSMKVVAVSTDFCEVCLFGPRFCSAIALNEDLLVDLNWTQTTGTETIGLRFLPLPR